jgi:hypothetical protein
MSIVVIQNGGLVGKDPADIKTYCYDWDASNLAPAVTIATSTWTITAISPSQVDAVLTKDSEAKLTAAQATTALQRTVTLDDRATRVRLTAGTLGQIYEIANKVVTTETPAQTKERSFRVLIENQ